MNKVTTINLNGRAYQLEESGEAVLRKYLETAAAKLAGNPDKDEIMADFEQAIADKFDQKLNGHKNVVSEREIEEILAAMGPVEGEASGAGADAEPVKPTDSPDTSDTSGNKGAPKRLYRLLDDKWVMGVCSGLAAYFNIDLALTRILFLVLILITHGFAAGVYIILAIVMPAAITEEEYSQAHGWTTRPPFNAHDFIEQAKMKYADLQKMHEEHKAKEAAAKAGGGDGTGAAAGGSAAPAGSTKAEMKAWAKKMKFEMKMKKQQMKHEWRAKQYEWYQNKGQNSRHHGNAGYDSMHARMDGNTEDSYYARRYGAGYGISRALYGFFAVLVSIGLLVAGIFWAIGLVQVIQHGLFYGYPLGAGHPLWVSIVFLSAAFYLVSLPFRLLLERAWGHARYRSAWREFVQAIMFLAVCAVLIYTARELFPQVNDLWNNMLVALSAKR